MGLVSPRRRAPDQRPQRLRESLRRPHELALRPLFVRLDAMGERDRAISNVITRLIGEERRQTGEKDPAKISFALLASRRK